MSQIRVKPEMKQIMKCRDAELMIVDSIATHKNSVLPAELSKHLSSCVSCNRFFIKYDRDFGALVSGRRKAPDPGFYDRFSIRMQSLSGQRAQKLKPLRRIVHFSPVVLTAAASVIFGIWLGSKWFSATQAGIENRYALSVEERSGMVEAFANEMHLTDETTLALESYFIENENSDNHDTK